MKKKRKNKTAEARIAGTTAPRHVAADKMERRRRWGWMKEERME